MKLATNILLFVLLVLSGFNYAQDNKTEVIIKTQITSPKVYLDGRLLNYNRSEFMFAGKITYSDLNILNSTLFASTGKMFLNFNPRLSDEYIDPTGKIFSVKSIIDDKSYNKIEFDFTNENDEEHFYDKPIFKILLGSFVALGAATAYFKIRADKRFNDYKKTNNSSFLDETNKYDTISGVTFSLMQINFGVLVYYFLRE